MSTEPPALTMCFECGCNEMAHVAESGRTYWHRGVTYDIPADLLILTCPDCGAWWMGGAETEAIDRAIREQRDAKNERGPDQP